MGIQGATPPLACVQLPMQSLPGTGILDVGIFDQFHRYSGILTDGLEQFIGTTFGGHGSMRVYVDEQIVPSGRLSERRLS